MNLAEGIVAEIRRVSEILPLYDAIPTGIFAATMMRAALNRAQKAMADGDVIEMLRCYEELKEFEA